MQVAAAAAARTRGRLTSILLTLAAPLVLYAIVRSALAGLPAERALFLPPTSAADQLRQLARNVSHPTFVVDEPMLALAKQAAQAEPLSFVPFFVAARAAEQDRTGIVALLEEARRRRATWLPIRLLLVSSYFADGRRGEMAKEIDYILRMNEPARMILLPELVNLLRFPDGRQQLAEMLAGNPPWEADFFNVARDRRVAPEHVEDLVRITQAAGRDASSERRLLVDVLVSAGRAQEARARWLQSLPPDQRERNRLLAFGDFKSSPSAGEFGWTVAALGVGRADLVGDGRQSRLRALYDGGSDAVLARQLIALAPGRYSLHVKGRLASQGGEGAGQLFWEVQCHPGGASLLRLPVSGLGGQDKTITANFAVPAGGCSGQNVRLAGQPNDMSAPVEAEFSEIGINRAR